MKYYFILSFLLICVNLNTYSQNCNNIDLSVSDDYSYNNESEDFSLPFNKNWNILIENQRAIIVGLNDNYNTGSASVLKNRNGYIIESAHNLSKSLIVDLFRSMKINAQNLNIENAFLKNIPTKIVEFDYKIINLNETQNTSGMIFFLVKERYTYVFMFNCNAEYKKCYFPFFENVMKSAYFGQEWY